MDELKKNTQDYLRRLNYKGLSDLYESDPPPSGSTPTYDGSSDSWTTQEKSEIDVNEFFIDGINIGDGSSTDKEIIFTDNDGSEHIVKWDDSNNQFNISNDLNVDGTITGIIDHGGLIGLSDDDHSQYLNLNGRSGQYIDDNITISGNLTVDGTEFIANTETLEIEDNLAIINSGETGDGITEGFAGWEADRGTLTNYKWGFDENTDLWKLGEVGDLQAVATRPDSITDDTIAFWDGTNNRLKFKANSDVNLSSFNDDFGSNPHNTSLQDVTDVSPSTTTGMTLGGNLSVDGTGDSYFQGNVGIGTTSPRDKLEISSNDPLIYINDEGGEKYPGIVWSDAGTRKMNMQYHSPGDYLYIYDDENNNTIMTWEHGGNVGIGTNSPDGKLDVVNNGNTQLHSRTTDSDGWASLYVGTDISESQGYLISYGSTHSNAGEVALKNSTANPLTFYSNANEQMRIDNSGNVGIGTTGPSEELEVSDVGRFSGGRGYVNVGHPNNSSDEGIEFYDSNDNAFYSIQMVGGGKLALRDDNQNNVVSFANDGSLESYFYGNVGIGTTSPSATVDVGGGTLNNATADNGLLVAGDMEVNGTIYSDGSSLATSDHNHDGTYLNESSNLSDLDDASSARTNLGLGTIATDDGSDYYTRTQADDNTSNSIDASKLEGKTLYNNLASIGKIAADYIQNENSTINTESVWFNFLENSGANTGDKIMVNGIIHDVNGNTWVLAFAHKNSSTEYTLYFASPADATNTGSWSIVKDSTDNFADSAMAVI